MLAAGTGFLFSFVLIFLRVPIAISLALTGFLGFGVLVGWQKSLTMLALMTKESTMSYGLVVIPLFILMGNLVAGAGISRELYRFAQAFMGHRRGGLAMATILSSGGFATVCGSSVATVVTIGKVALPSMRERGYADSLSTAAIAAGATLGIVIPPSVLLIIYGIMTETHIGMLYAAGFVPGILGIIGYLAAVRWVVWRNPEAAPLSPKADWAERIDSLKGIWAVAALLILVLGGIYSGFFTASEAAGIGAFGAFLLAWSKGQLTFESLHAMLLDTAQTSAVLFAMLIGANLFTEFLNFTGAHTSLLAFVEGVGLSPFAVILVICGVYIVLGALMEELSMMLLTVPLFFPIVIGLGYDPVWFGILVIVLCEIGLICPPIGVNLFVMRSVAPDVPLSLIMRGIVPFVAVDIIRVAILAISPALTLWLPYLLFTN